MRRPLGLTKTCISWRHINNGPAEIDKGGNVKCTRRYARSALWYIYYLFWYRHNELRGVPQLVLRNNAKVFGVAFTV